MFEYDYDEVIQQYSCLEEKKQSTLIYSYLIYILYDKRLYDDMREKYSSAKYLMKNLNSQEETLKNF